MITPKNLGDSAYENIAQAVTTGAFRPGERLTIRGLSEMLGVSSTPVRDAIKRLVLEGALEQQGTKIVRVPMISLQAYTEIAELRVVLEGIAACSAAKRATPDQISRMKATIAENEEAIEAKDWASATRLNTEFHFSLAEMAEKPVLLEILQLFWLRVGPPIAAHYEFGGRSMIEHHYTAYEAIRAGDGDAAARAIGADIEGAREGILETIERLNPAAIE